MLIQLCFLPGSSQFQHSCPAASTAAAAATSAAELTHDDPAGEPASARSILQLRHQPRLLRDQQQ